MIDWLLLIFLLLRLLLNLFLYWLRNLLRLGLGFLNGSSIIRPRRLLLFVATLIRRLGSWRMLADHSSDSSSVSREIPVVYLPGICIPISRSLRNLWESAFRRRVGFLLHIVANDFTLRFNSFPLRQNLPLVLVAILIRTRQRSSLMLHNRRRSRNLLLICSHSLASIPLSSESTSPHHHMKASAQQGTYP